ncbi:hypothetical protein cypCar_00042888 [Cyprinus carpio]|nr:hypothetical protein cypCar_00042888 [Cyprinus carpio]
MTTQPDRLEALTEWLKDNLQTNYSFNLQYQDPKFNNELCNLTDISELPEKPTIKIIPVINLTTIPAETECFSESSSQADTEILSNSSLDRSFQWPDIFHILKFSVDVEYRLCQGNLLYLKDGTNLKVIKEMKHDILEKLAETMYEFKAYPTKEEFEAVAKALVQSQACLKEQGSSYGWEGWKNSLKFKMGNYRNKMRQLGRLEVTMNGGKCGRHTADGNPPNKDIKKPKKGEINFLPENPEGMDDQTWKEFVRKEVVNEKPDISKMVLRWPSLFKESQVYYEFNRVVGKNLRENFFDALVNYSPNLIEIFRKKNGLAGQLLAELLRQTKDVNDKDSYQQIPVGILCLDPESPQLNPFGVHIILEGSLVMEPENLPQAFCLLFGLIYALHLD